MLKKYKILFLNSLVEIAITLYRAVSLEQDQEFFKLNGMHLNDVFSSLTCF